MTPNALRAFVLSYLTAFVLLAIAWPAIKVRRSTGRWPIMVHDPATAHGYVARVFMVMVLSVAVAAIAFVLGPASYGLLWPIARLESAGVQTAGLGLLAVALPWSVIAQQQMGDSWRIGIDAENHTRLVAHGLYRISRNPIYVGLFAGVLGLFLVLPNVLTLVTVVAAWPMIQVEIRLEESHLRSLHGAAFDDYCARVRRWL